MSRDKERSSSLRRKGFVLAAALSLISCSEPFVAASPPEQNSSTSDDSEIVAPTLTTQESARTEPDALSTTTPLEENRTGLRTGFNPDPFQVSVIGRPQRAAAVTAGEDCIGFIGDEPSFTLHWQGDSSALRFIFVADDVDRDPVLVVKMPDGQWKCNDDGPQNLDPVLDILNPQEGLYDIWVGTFDSADDIGGSLFITERDILSLDL